MNRLYGNAKTDEYGNEETATDRIRDPEFFQKKLKNIQKKEPVKIVKKPQPVKPTYLNGNVIDITPMIDDEWWKIFEPTEPPKDEVLLRVPRKELRGLASILKRG